MDHSCQGEMKKQGHSSIPPGSASDLLGEEAKPALELEASMRSPVLPATRIGPEMDRGLEQPDSVEELEERDRKEVSKCEQDTPRTVGRTETDPKGGGGQQDLKGLMGGLCGHKDAHPGCSRSPDQTWEEPDQSTRGRSPPPACADPRGLQLPAGLEQQLQLLMPTPLSGTGRGGQG